MRTFRIAVLNGDGIGPEIMAATTMVLEAASEWLKVQNLTLDLAEYPVGLAALEALGSTLPRETFEAVTECHGTILGPVMNHVYDLKKPGVLNPSRELRKRLDLYANVRPVKTYDRLGLGSPGVDIVVVRENTEGFYSDRNVIDGNGELRPDADTVISVRIVTRKASERIMRTAYQLAGLRNGKKRVTAAHKANVLRLGCGLFLEARDSVAVDYPDIASDDYHADALAMKLVMRPSDFDVIVATNMFGDILSDMTAGLVGGLGLAPGLNIGTDIAVAQAVHGAAPDIAGLGSANPVAVLLSSAMLFDWLAARYSEPAFHHLAEDIRAAAEDSFDSSSSRTVDIGGRASTMEAAISIAKLLELRLQMRANDA